MPVRFPRLAGDGTGRLRQRASKRNKLDILNGRERVGYPRLAFRQLFNHGDGIHEHVPAASKRERRNARLLNLPASLCRKSLPPGKRGERAESIVIARTEADVARRRERDLKRVRARGKRADREDGQDNRAEHVFSLHMWDYTKFQ